MWERSQDFCVLKWYGDSGSTKTRLRSQMSVPSDSVTLQHPDFKWKIGLLFESSKRLETPWPLANSQPYPWPEIFLAEWSPLTSLRGALLSEGSEDNLRPQRLGQELWRDEWSIGQGMQGAGGIMSGPLREGRGLFKSALASCVFWRIFTINPARKEGLTKHRVWGKDQGISFSDIN